MKPFDRYEGKGRRLLGVLEHHGSCRRDFGPRVFKQCGTRCVYCERALGESYDAWLAVCVDHVIPEGATARGFRAEWVQDLANQVTCCLACNQFLQDSDPKIQVVEEPPLDEASFFDLRDRVYERKRARALEQHAEERVRYASWCRTPGQV